MRGFRRALEVWNGFWFTPEAPQRAAAFRIALGFYLLVYLGSMLPHVELLFSDQGVYVPYLVPDYAPPPPVAQLLFWAWLGGVVLLTLGYRVGATALLVLALFLYHYFLQLAVKQSSFERLIAIYLLVLAFSGAGGAWAALPSTRVGPATAWPRRVLLMQTALLYFGAGLWKALNPRWHSGRLLEATLQGMWATPLGFWFTARGWSEGTWTALSWSVIVFELLLGPAFLWRRTRTLAVMAGTLFHLANATILAIPEFLVCVTPYPLFLPEDTVRRAGSAVARGFSRVAVRMPRWRARGRAS